VPLVDTGVLLAAASPRDDRHKDCLDVLRATRGPLLSTLAVMTELFYFVHDDGLRSGLAWKFFSRGAVRIARIDEAELPKIEVLMLKYANRPMDFADATLVHVAGREGIADILTIDHDDFESYRFGRNRRFRIAPGRR
jgi:hypothetical protein